VAVGSDGSYSISVPPGRYSVVGTSPLYNSGRTRCFAMRPVTVSDGTDVVADVLCQEM
jgi:hypothetical protein